MGTISSLMNDPDMISLENASIAMGVLENVVNADLTPNSAIQGASSLSNIM